VRVNIISDRFDTLVLIRSFCLRTKTFRLRAKLYF